MKKLSLLFLTFLFAVAITLTSAESVLAVSPTPSPSLPPQIIPCGCPKGMTELPKPNEDAEMSSMYTARSEECTNDYSLWESNPFTYHYWVKDVEITSQGKADDRARQFIYWVINSRSINNHPVLKSIWGLSSNIASFIVILIGVIMGLGFIIGQRSNFQTNIKVWPSIFKIGGALLYIAFSAAIVLFLIQMSEILMKFFIETLGGNKLFNIYFSGISRETNYVNFVGCRDLNYSVQEAVQAELFLLKLTNITYYVMGAMLILREVILWLLLFVSPFLAILLPFVFIRNVGWIWIGVFFQWLFYGPLFALFLGGLAKIWSVGIPYQFDFSRVDSVVGYIYPTGINLVYGGPAQGRTSSIISFLNNGNYVDTFVEYVITLIMLWAVTFFPWWLLRIFRDYCCDGINAMKNILMSMYDQTRGNQTPPSLTPTPNSSKTGVAINIPNTASVTTRIKMETMEEIKRVKTEDISRNLNLSVSKLSDVANFETNRQINEVVTRSLNYLANPTKAETPTERQKYMNIRTELFSRAVKDDPVARQILSATSTSRIEQIQKREEILKTTPTVNVTTFTVPTTGNLTQTTISNINNHFFNQVTNNSNLLNTISEASKSTVTEVKNIVNSYQRNLTQPINNIVTNVTTETGIPKTKVIEILKIVTNLSKSNKDLIKTIKEKASVTNSVNTLVEDKTKFNTITAAADVPPIQVRTIIESYGRELDQQNTPLQVIEKISKQTGVDTEKVRLVVRKVEDYAKTKGIEEGSVIEAIINQLNVAAEPEKHIEQSVVIPPSISIEDYEDVKKMWVEQYEKGEVPVTENIRSRSSWVEQDIVFITNTLNKLLSPDEKLKTEGLDDLAYILPIFIINDLKGEELLVYLKAKLEAAKIVSMQMQKEKDITEKLKAKSDEELVDVELPKAATDVKTMEMKQEIPVNETNPK